jgi:hypothetical protein
MNSGNTSPPSGTTTIISIPGADSSRPLGERVASLDWDNIESTLNLNGFAVTPTLLAPTECEALTALYDEKERFRSRIVMERYAFGRGEYKYFGYPLPDPVARLRTALYEQLAPIANRWHSQMKISERFPTNHEEFTGICHAAGQLRPTPLMLSYGPGDYCCLHQDLYGEHVFPLQVVFLLSAPDIDFTGGELLLTENDPKNGGRAEVVPLLQGHAALFPVNCRPMKSTRGFYRGNSRHGVSQLRTGHRHTLGIIFHDAN